MIIKIIIILWLFSIAKEVSTHLFIWQAKSYRADRLLSAVNEPGGWKMVFSYVAMAKYGTLVVSFFLPYVYGLWLVFALYTILWVNVIKKAITKKLRLPVITKKSMALGLLSFFTVIAVTWIISRGEAFTPALLLLADLASLVIVSFWIGVFVPITKAAKGQLVKKAKTKRNAYKNLHVVGITGSFGKTSTKEILYHILASKFHVAKTKNHENTEIGAARALMSMPKDTEVLVAEMAAYKKGDIKEISEVLQPTIGLITGIGSQHVSLFGSQELITQTKFELASSLPRGAPLVVNGDSGEVQKHIARHPYKGECIVYSTERSANLEARHIQTSLLGTTFIIVYKGKEVPCKTVLLGRASVSNILGATAVALVLGMDMQTIKDSIATLEPIAQTLERKEGINGVLVIDDSYNASLEGVMHALHVLGETKGKKIVIMPSLIELGNTSQEAHRQIGETLEKTVDLAIITDAKYKEYMQSKNISFITDPHAVVARVKREATENTVLLFEGRVSENIIKALCQN